MDKRNSREHLIQLLHEKQNSNKLNFISEPQVKEISKKLNLTKSEIYGVIHYYTMFSDQPRGKYLIRFCKSIVCRLEGDLVLERIKNLLNIKIGETTADALFTLEYSECLGRCHQAPTMMINNDYYDYLTPDKAEDIIRNIKQKEKTTKS